MTYVFLFYPRRRRHTSWPRDWSSDVCSSDLEVALVALLRRRPGRERLARNARGVLLARPGRLRRLVRRALVLRCLRLGVRLLVPGSLLRDRKSTRLNSSHVAISYAVFCLKKKK